LEFVDIHRRRLPDGRVSLGFTSATDLEVADIVGWGAEGTLPYLIQWMAGPAAEAQVDPLYVIKAGADAMDRQSTWRYAAIAMYGVVETPDAYEVPRDALKARKGEVVALCHRAEVEAHRFVAENRTAIEAVAAALIRKTSLTGDEVAAVVGAATTA
jgi:hypothetical protein